MLDVRLDAARGIIRVKSTGLLTLDEVHRYKTDIAAASDIARQRFGRVRLFVDSSEALVHPAAVIEAFEKIGPVTTATGDRLAILVLSSLARMQVRRVLADERERTFTSAEAAMQWPAED